MDDLLLSEYQLRMKAYQLSRVDREYELHLQAWLNQQAQATKSKGKKTVSVFRTFNDFFNYEERVNEIVKPKPKEVKRSKTELLLLKANS